MGDVTPALKVNESKSKVQRCTGKITDDPAPADEKYEEPLFAKEPPSSEIFGENTGPLSTDSRELQELYDPIDSQSMSTHQSSTIRPAAGAGGSSTCPPEVSRGRRHVRKTIFENERNNEYGLELGPAAGLGPQVDNPNDNQEIFSIKGTRSIKINRHRDTVNVFPSGCMGVPQDALSKMPIIELNVMPPSTEPELEQDQEQDQEQEEELDVSPQRNQESSVESTPRQMDPLSPKTKSNSEGESTARTITQNGPSSGNSMQYRRIRPLSAVQRNPLTGVGYEDRDFIRQSNVKKRDGNPVLGQGYETKDVNNKSKKIPPGGHSRGLW